SRSAGSPRRGSGLCRHEDRLELRGPRFTETSTPALRKNTVGYQRIIIPPKSKEVSMSPKAFSHRAKFSAVVFAAFWVALTIVISPSRASARQKSLPPLIDRDLFFGDP